MKGNGIGRQYIDQRKIYKDGTRSLSIDHPGLINFPLSRMNIMFWSNIETEGEDIDMIKNNITLSSLNVVYDETSLFHYFSDNQEVTEVFHDMFTMAEADNKLTPVN